MQIGFPTTLPGKRFVSPFPLSPQDHQIRSGYSSELTPLLLVLEIGTYVGYSAAGWSHAVGADGGVMTLEFSPVYARDARENFEKYNIKNVHVIVGDANET